MICVRIISFKSEIADCKCFQIKLNKIFAWEPTPYVNESQVGSAKAPWIQISKELLKKGSANKIQITFD